MRIFQNFDIYPAYLALRRGRIAQHTHAAITDDLFHDRFIALHMLKPTLERHPDACFSVGNDAVSQMAWADARGWQGARDLADILRAQIEDHRAEIFYNHDPLRFGSDFVKMLPGCVRKTVAWRAAPSPGADFAAYDHVVCNFPSILRSYEEAGWKADYFFPAYDPAMQDYAENADRPLDVVFAGTYSRHHQNRSRIVEAIAQLPDHVRVQIHLLQSRPTRWASALPSFLPFVSRYALPRSVQRRAGQALFGRDLYALFGQAKIVVNGAIDMSGNDRGNMRCFEVMGCGALLLSDAGNYPAGMQGGETMLTYDSPQNMVDRIMAALEDVATRQGIAQAGHAMIRDRYSKEAQWRRFLDIIG